jgi:hypothetical protein
MAVEVLRQAEVEPEIRIISGYLNLLVVLGHRRAAEYQSN